MQAEYTFLLLFCKSSNVIQSVYGEIPQRGTISQSDKWILTMFNLQGTRYKMANHQPPTAGWIFPWNSLNKLVYACDNLYVAMGY